MKIPFFFPIAVIDIISFKDIGIINILFDHFLHCFCFIKSVPDTGLQLPLLPTSSSGDSNKVTRNKLSYSTRSTNCLVPIACKSPYTVYQPSFANNTAAYSLVPGGVIAGNCVSSNTTTTSYSTGGDPSRVHNPGSLPSASGVIYVPGAPNSSVVTGSVCGGISYTAAHPPIVCNYCGKEFAFASDLRRHTRSHTGEKPFECPICTFKTSQRYNLERHKKIHEPKPTTNSVKIQ